jgi:hypothetical protein
MVRDVAICAVILVVAALLGILVHPLLWSVAILSVAWLIGHDPTGTRT